MTKRPYLNEAILCPNLESVVSEVSGACLLICPQKGQWSDFGLSPRIEVYFINHSGHSVLIDARAKLLVVVKSNESSYKFSQLSEPISVEDLEAKGVIVVLSLGTRGGYRDLIRLARPDIAKRLLLRANDIAALNSYSPNSSILKKARSVDGFKDDLLREEEAQFAFISLNKIFTERIDVGLTEIRSLGAELDFEGNLSLPINFEFNEVLERVQPINVIIGPNGMGKTRLLMSLANAVVQRKADINNASHFPSDLEPTAGRFITKQPIVPIVAFTYERSRWRKLAKLGAQIVPLGISPTNWRQLTSVLQQLALESDAGRFNLLALVRVLERIINVNDIQLPLVKSHTINQHLYGMGDWINLTEIADTPHPDILANLDCNKSPRLTNSSIGEYSLSSGQLSLTFFCASLFLKAKRGTLVLIDEPENHLHPQYITLLMQILASTLIATEARAIVVTHSPFVVREVDSNAVMVVQRDPDNQMAIYQPSLQTLGGDVAMISDHVFGDGNIRKGFEEQIDIYLSAERIRSLSDEQLVEITAAFGMDGARYARQKCLEHEHA